MSDNGSIVCCKPRNSSSVRGHVVRGMSTIDTLLKDSLHLRQEINLSLTDVTASNWNSNEAPEVGLGFFQYGGRDCCVQTRIL